MPEENWTFSSTRIDSAVRDSDSGDTVVTFSRGDTYTLTGLPEDVWQRWKHAYSAGSFYSTEIEGVYD